MPLKGPVLAQLLYGDQALRPFADLDILVHRDDAFKAYNLLLSCGYTSMVNLAEEQFDAYTQNEYGVEMMAGQGHLMIDLHWDLAGRYLDAPFGLELFEDELVRTPLNGQEVLQPPVEHLLLYQCLHGAKGCWSNLESVCSVAEIVRSCSYMDWEELQRLAREMRCERIVALGLFLGEHLLDAPVLDFALKKDLSIQSMARKICDRFFSDGGGTGQEKILSDFSIFHMKVRDSLADSIRYGAALMFRPSRQEWRHFPLPKSLYFLYSPIRVMRLTWGFACSKLRTCRPL